MPNDFYQIQLENKSHPDYLKWEKLNFALRRIFSKLNELAEATTTTTPEAEPEAEPEAGAGATALVDTVVPIAPAFDVVQSAPYTAMLGMENPLAPDNALAPGWKNVIQLGVEIADDENFTNIIETLVIGGTGLQRQIFYWVANAAGTWYARAFAVNLIGRSLPSSTVMFYLDNSMGDTDVPSAPTITVYNTDDLDTVQFREVTARINFSGCTNTRSLWQATIQFHTSATMTNPEASPIYNPGANKIKIRQGSDRFIDPTATFVSSGVLPGHYVMWTLESSWPGSPATRTNIAMISEVVSNTELKFVSPYLGASGDYPYRITLNYEQVDSGAGFYPYTHIESKAARDKGYVDIKIALPAGVNYYCRGWLFNSFGRSSASTVTAAFQTTDLPTGPTDSVLPGVPTDFTFTNKMGKFVGDWGLPTTGFNTIDDVVIQGAADSGFTSLVDTSKGWGVMRHAEAVLPNATRYLRVAWHNLSGVASDTTVKAAIEAAYGAGSADTGWGPFTSALSTSTGDLTADVGLPGVPTNFAFTGANGRFVGDWGEPATNYTTLDDCCIQGASNSSFTTDVDTSIGWGLLYHAEATLPNTTRYLRIAWHNQSGVASNATTKAAIEAKYGAHSADYGWGAFCTYLGPVSSGQVSFASAASGARTEFSTSLGFIGYDGSGNIVSHVDPATGKATLKSGTSGARYEMDPTNGIRLYNSGGTLSTQLKTDGFIYAQYLYGLRGTSNPYLDLTLANEFSFFSSGVTQCLFVTLGSTVAFSTTAGPGELASISFDTVGTGSTISWQITGTTRAQLSASTLTLTGVNIALDSGKTVDGVDVSALNTTVSDHTGASSAVHGTTGAVMGANMANTPGSSFTLICQSNGKIGPRYGHHATNWPTTSDCADGEMLLWWNEASGVRLYIRNADNMEWIAMST